MQLIHKIKARIRFNNNFQIVKSKGNFSNPYLDGQLERTAVTTTSLQLSWEY